MELRDKIINFLGDSITEGCGTSDQSARFSALIESRCGLKRANNYGIGGTRIARQQVKKFGVIDELDFCARCTRMDPEADIVVVMGGTNDQGHGDAPIGFPQDRTPDTFWGACHSMMRSLLETYPQAVIVICTPLHCWCEENPRGAGGKEEDAAPLSLYVDIIRQTAEYYALPVLDLWKTSGLQPAVPAIREKYMPDGCHPNDAGHRLLADRIIGFLSAL